MMGNSVSAHALAESLIGTTREVEEVYVELGGDYSIFEQDHEHILEELEEYVYVCEECTQWVDANLGCSDCGLEH